MSPLLSLQSLSLLRTTRRGLKFEGNPCEHGHTLRYRSNGMCVECAKQYARNHNRIRRFV